MKDLCSHFQLYETRKTRLIFEKLNLPNKALIPISCHYHLNSMTIQDEKPKQAKQKVTKKAAIGNKKTTKHQKGENSKSSKVKDEYSDLSVSWPMNRMGK